MSSASWGKGRSWMTAVAAYGRSQIVFRHKGYKWMINLLRYGCSNRPFYRMVVMREHWPNYAKLIKPKEILGSFDPMANEHGERVASVNIERVEYWLGKNAVISEKSAHLLGLMGYLPVHPTTYRTAYRRRVQQAVEEGTMEEPVKVDTSQLGRIYGSEPRRYIKRDGSEQLTVEFDEKSVHIKPAIISREKLVTDSDRGAGTPV